MGYSRRLLARAALAIIAGGAAVDRAFAEGRAEPWAINLQDPASPVMEKVHDFHNMLLIIQFGIVALVLAVLAYVIVRFNAKRNPQPSTTAHNTLLEIVWTAVPIVILVIIAIPSLKLLYFSNKAQDPEMTLKVTAHQWYWSYNYPDHGDFGFDSVPVATEELQPGQPRLLTVDNPIVLPVGTNIQVLVGTDDVIHNWAVPSLGLKTDAVPGRANETWVRIDKEGTYYGMCSELCGVNHYYMPIQIHAVSKEKFAEWVDQAKQQFAAGSGPPLRLVDATKK
jgi:cytochrome c oxidase subunit 2